MQRGYFEAITYSFVDPALQARFCPGEAALALRNPIAADLAAMRLSLWPGLAKALVENQRRQQARVRLFEIGRRFSAGERRPASRLPVVAGLAAGPALAGAVGRRARRPSISSTSRPTSRRCSRATGAGGEFRFVAARHPALHPGQTARILRDGTPVGWLGRLHPELERQLDLTYSAIVFEVETESGLAATVPQHREVSRFPAVRRDIAVVVDESVSVQALLDCVRARRAARC